MTILNLVVAANDDDAIEKDDGSSFSHTGTSLAIQSATTASIRSNGGFRYQNVTIPPGATINSATSDIEVADAPTDDMSVQIHCHDVDNSDNFTNDADVTSRARTAAFANWIGGLSAPGIRTSPDFAAAVQEVIDRPGWASGNALTVIFAGRNADGAGGNACTVVAFNHATLAPATLDIDYTPPDLSFSFTGSIDLEAEVVTTLLVSFSFTGTLDLEAEPASLSDFDTSFSFTGSIDLEVEMRTAAQIISEGRLPSGRTRVG